MPTASELHAACPGCGHELWQERRGEWTLQNRILKMRKGGDLVAKCSECAAEVPVPFLALVEPARPRRRRLVVDASRLDTGAGS
jgi:hypothetical protein